MQLEHLIYGTFPDLPGSQQAVYKSPVISAEVEQRLVQFYNEFGDCKSEAFQTALSVLRLPLPDGTQSTAITRTSQQGTDFSGRWGALLRHSAVLTENQYRLLGAFLPLIGERLVREGSWEELRQRGDLVVDESLWGSRLIEFVGGLDFSNYADDLARLLRGERLVLYAESSTQKLDDYLLSLFLLLPLDARLHLSWTQFTFRPLTEFDLSVIYSSRYEAPEVLQGTFQTDGVNSLAELMLEQEEIESYLRELESALNTGETELLHAILAERKLRAE